MHGIEVFNEKEWYPEAIQWAMDKNLAITANSDIHDFYENAYNTEMYPVRPMTLVFAKERSEESLREAMFAKRTAALFFDKLVGRKEFVEPLVMESIKIADPHLYQDGYAYFSVTNTSDIEFTFVKLSSDNSELPGRFILPRRGSIILKAKKQKEQILTCSYKLENVLTGVEDYLKYDIIVK